MSTNGGCSPSSLSYTISGGPIWTNSLTCLQIVSYDLLYIQWNHYLRPHCIQNFRGLLDSPLLVEISTLFSLDLRPLDAILSCFS